MKQSSTSHRTLSMYHRIVRQTSSIRVDRWRRRMSWPKRPQIDRLWPKMPEIGYQYAWDRDPYRWLRKPRCYRLWIGRSAAIEMYLRRKNIIIISKFSSRLRSKSYYFFSFVFLIILKPVNYAINISIMYIDSKKKGLIM